jgi:hypothetical protein
MGQKGPLLHGPSKPGQAPSMSRFGFGEERQEAWCAGAKGEWGGSSRCRSGRDCAVLGESVRRAPHVAVHATEPDFKRLGVVHAVDRPVVRDLERVAEVEQEVVGGHRAAGEEVLAHPVVVPRGLEVVGETLVQEDVDEQEAALLEPAVDVRHKLLVVLHMLEHFDADNLFRHADTQRISLPD